MLIYSSFQAYTMSNDLIIHSTYLLPEDSIAKELQVDPNINIRNGHGWLPIVRWTDKDSQMRTTFVSEATYALSVFADTFTDISKNTWLNHLSSFKGKR